MESKQVIICTPPPRRPRRQTGFKEPLQKGVELARGNQTALPQDSLGSAKNATRNTGLTLAACLGQDNYIPGCRSRSAPKEGNTSPAPELL